MNKIEDERRGIKRRDGERERRGERENRKEKRKEIGHGRKIEGLKGGRKVRK